ncbi:3'-5' exonuclease [Bacteroides sp. 224]|uniref:3'-5' exonuclease n=1 Tax=Bacteroides sp. 224 TaxID=2302936 RepID=UPI0013D0A1FF|nr:3'-5' exonuclease [Bacteroides sp. 224]NDV66761.1 3'-5' exonuclease [Bacteroides sp. 224]
MKIVFFDLETTGTLPNRHGIHQISGEIVIDGETKETFDFNVCPNPQAEILEEALKIAGVTKEQILAYPPMSVVFKQFVEMLGKYVDKYDKKDKYYLAGFNNSAFDNPFLRGWFLQNGDNYFGSWFWSNSFDLMILATPHLAHKQPEMENFRLATVAKHLGIEVIEEKLHDASYDIALTKAIYDVIFKA